MKAIHCCYPIIFEFVGFYHELKVLESIQEFKNCTKYITGLDFKYGLKDENIKIEI